MGYLIALFATLVRLCRATDGVHTDGSGYVRTLAAECFRRRSTRVRKFAETLPYVAELPRVPAPRTPVDALPSGVLAPVPHDYVPVVDTSAVAEPAALVRGHYRAWERQVEQRRTDRDRLGIAVLADIASAANRSEVSA